MGNPICDAVSHEGFACERPLGHVSAWHDADDVTWSEVGADLRFCLDVADEPGPLPSRCNRNPGHDGHHEAREFRRVLNTWPNQWSDQ